MEYEQIDLKNITHPVQEVKNIMPIKIRKNVAMVHEFELGLNEFIDHRDKIGLFDQDPEPYSFLSFEKSHDSIQDLQSTEYNTYNFSNSS